MPDTDHLRVLLLGLILAVNTVGIVVTASWLHTIEADIQSIQRDARHHHSVMKGFIPH